MVMAINWRSQLFEEEHQRILNCSIKRLQKICDYMANALFNVLFYKTTAKDNWRQIVESVMNRITAVMNAFIEYTGVNPIIDIV